MAYIQSVLWRLFSPDYGAYSARIMAYIQPGVWRIFSPYYGVYSVRIMAYIQSGLCSCLVSAVYHSTKNFFYDIMESDQHYYKTSCTYWIHTMYKNKMLTSFIGKSLNIQKNRQTFQKAKIKFTERFMKNHFLRNLSVNDGKTKIVHTYKHTKNQTVIKTFIHGLNVTNEQD